LFVALRGERFDGHAFLPQALAAGAGAVVVARDKSVEVAPFAAAGCGVYEVDEPLYALQALGAAHRASQTARVVGVTGSVGKTTVKEFLAAAFTNDAGAAQVLKTQGNLNSQIGVPLMALMLRPEHRYASLELGLSQFGEMSRISRVAQPDIATITAVAAAHLEFLGDLDGVARAKAEIFEGVRPGGIAVLPAWDERLVNLGRSLSCVVKWVGTQAGSFARLVEVSSQHVSVEIQGTCVEINVPLVGLHHARNAALALACAVAAGADPARAAAGIAQAEVPGGRSRLVRDIPGLLVLDDSYNANPASTSAALAALALLPGARRVALLGEMRELGANSAEAHYEMGAEAARHGVQLLLSFGNEAQSYADGARSAGLLARNLGEQFEPALALLLSVLRSGDALLIKGSRGARMERFLDALRARRGASTPNI
jgi:UDP-N-acetylmuramoyl-tripeptide--D-alanyl-D-alanine ligase